MSKWIFSAILSLFLLVLSGAQFEYKTAEAYYPPTSISVFTPSGYALLTASTVSASGVLGSTAASTPAATTAVIQNLGTDTAYVLLGASSVVATTATGYPVQGSQTAVLTVRNATHFAAITEAGSPVISVTTGY